MCCKLGIRKKNRRAGFPCVGKNKKPEGKNTLKQGFNFYIDN